MRSAFWSIIAFALIFVSTVVSYAQYQSGALHNEVISSNWNRPD
ncbi:hypothetical protein SAMN04515619_11694 [Collimonas sp. OK412]|jgi:hypothetical protein|nr:hypothetical protein SAMN04515619_11694 [Collimonas sp. OK412]